MSIEEDVKRCKELIKIEHANWIGMSNQSAISNVLAEREQDKKRIQELEEENTLQRRQLNSAFDNGYIHTDKIRKLIANETINISGFECIAVEDLQELLEGERK